MKVIKSASRPGIDTSGLLLVLLFTAGLFILSIGVVCMMRANLGVNSWDVLHIGLANMSSISIGVWVQIVGIIIIALVVILERQVPKLGTVLNIILIGFFIDWILDANIIPTFTSFLARLALLCFGIILIGFGAGMYVASNIGAGPRDGLTLVLANRLGWSIRRIRTIIEACALFLGWLTHGPISLGTILSVFMIGPVMQLSLQFWKRQVEKIEYLYTTDNVLRDFFFFKKEAGAHNDNIAS